MANFRKSPVLNERLIAFITSIIDIIFQLNRGTEKIDYLINTSNDSNRFPN